MCWAGTGALQLPLGGRAGAQGESRKKKTTKKQQLKSNGNFGLDVGKVYLFIYF